LTFSLLPNRGGPRCRGGPPVRYNHLTDSHSVVLLSNRGHAIDLNSFWAKLRELIDANE
jgi:hypothetical protein